MPEEHRCHKCRFPPVETRETRVRNKLSFSRLRRPGSHSSRYAITSSIGKHEPVAVCMYVGGGGGGGGLFGVGGTCTPVFPWACSSSNQVPSSADSCVFPGPFASRGECGTGPCTHLQEGAPGPPVLPGPLPLRCGRSGWCPLAIEQAVAAQVRTAGITRVYPKSLSLESNSTSDLGRGHVCPCEPGSRLPRLLRPLEKGLAVCGRLDIILSFVRHQSPFTDKLNLDSQLFTPSEEKGAACRSTCRVPWSCSHAPECSAP